MSIDTPLPTKLRLALPIIEPPAEPAREARTMPHRLIPLFPYPKMFLAGLASSGGSIFAAAMDERAVAIGMAILAFGAVIAQPAMRAYDGFRERKRANDKADRAEQTGEFEIEVRRRVELEEEVKRLRTQNADQQQQIDKLRKGAGKAVKQLSEKVEANAERIAAVEAHQGSSSGLDIPATPVDVKP